MRFNEQQARFQAVLFASGGPMPLLRAAAAAGIPPEEAMGTVEEIGRFYREHGLPFEVAVLGEDVQLCTAPAYSGVIREALAAGNRAPLSQAAMEALAVVAYNQPVTKAFVEQVRGVDSGGVMNLLVQKELIEEAGRLELPGRPIVYRTTAHFLRCFSLSSLEELPSVHEGEEAQP